MAITKLTVENFKSFDKLEVELRPFNIVVGSNASGKSNFLDVFRFLRDVAEDSLESAVGIRGGAETLRNFNLEENQELRIAVKANDVQRRLVKIHDDYSAIGVKTDNESYELMLRYDESDAGFEVVTDRLIEQFTVFDLQPADDHDLSTAHLWSPHLQFVSVPVPIRTHMVEQRNFGTGEALYQREDGSIGCYVDLNERIPLEERDVSMHHGDTWILDRPDEVMLGGSQRSPFLPRAPHSLVSISTYDFDPSKAQLAVPPSGSRELDEDAENLSVILREIIRTARVQETPHQPRVGTPSICS